MAGFEEELEKLTARVTDLEGRLQLVEAIARETSTKHAETRMRLETLGEEVKRLSRKVES